ncbi:MAG TPA: AMP-binding protein [Azospirillum sp.]|nr:AMP-binding protein [Azospirillum sp.]
MTDTPAWEAVRAELTGPAGLNMGWAAVDRHVAGGQGGRVALRWNGRDGGKRAFTYADLAERTNRFADALRRLGVRPGETVFTLLPRVPELYVALLGALKAGCVAAPLYAAFGPEPLRLRLALGKARVLVTTDTLWRRKGLPGAGFDVLTVGGNPPEGAQDLAALLEQADPRGPVAPTGPADLALLHFTSGTTGAPKGALHVHDALVAQVASARQALDLGPGDVYWCTADPGWVTGTVYGILAPLACGATVVANEGDFDPARWYGLIERQHVAVWYTTPTAIRMLMRAGDELPGRFDLTSLRRLASVGEPLNPEAVVWGRTVLGQPFVDTWWQTETGAIMLANLDAVPGALGRPLPGIVADVRQPDADGVGELVLRPPWPSLFRGYLGDEERTGTCFAEGWYRTGDLVRRDGQGCYWFVGRADDIVKSSGHLVGPFEVESVLLEHPAVAEAAVIGKPDPVAGEVVKAFVALKPGIMWSDDLASELIAHGRRRLGPALAPKEVAAAAALPHTRSGKIMRRLLKARELGLPEGDVSALE